MLSIVLGLWTLWLIVYLNSPVVGISIVTGQSFVIGFPLNKSATSDIYFLLFTLLQETITVEVTSQWYPNQQLKGVVSFARDNSAVYHLLEKKNMKLAETKIHHTYALSSASNFSVTVVVVIDQVSLESIQAVPVEGWGKKYFAVLAMYYPSVQVVTASENKVTISVHSNKTIPLHIYYQNTNVKYSSIVHVSLLPYESFNFGNCLENQNLGVPSGVEVIGLNPVGVITSTCTGRIDVTSCHKGQNNTLALSHPTGFLAEMHLPESSSGKEFVLMNLNLTGSQGFFAVVAVRENVKVLIQHIVVDKHTLAHAGQMLRLNASKGLSFLKSNRPVQVMYMHLSFCNGGRTESGLDALSLVVPNGLFMDAYFWITKDVGNFDLKHYLVYICKAGHFPDLQFDTAALSTNIIRQLAAIKVGSTTWQQGTMQLRAGEHYFYGRKGSKFGVYLYGFQGSLSYMHAAGFISSPINGVCMFTTSAMVAGDLLDNDCDGRVDEERGDSTDNDLDGLIDEDLMPNPTIDGGWGKWHEWYCIHCTRNTVLRNRLCNNPRPQNIGRYCAGIDIGDKTGNCHRICHRAAPNVTDYTEEEVVPGVPVSGVWSDWTSWECSKNCAERYLLRTRKCDSPPPDPGGDKCPGSSYQFGDKLCTLICPNDCPEKTWGNNCTRSCEFCRGDCDKVTGVCRLCESGYRFPQLYCSVECGKYTFGPNCQGNCFRKCDGLDCMDRILGLCPPEQRKFLWLLLLLCLPIPVGIFYFLSGHGDNKDDSYKNAIEEKITDMMRTRSLRAMAEERTSLTSLARMAGIYYFAPEESDV